MSPATVKSFVGAVVPIPTLPVELSITNLALAAVALFPIKKSVPSC